MEQPQEQPQEQEQAQEQEQPQEQPAPETPPEQPQEPHITQRQVSCGHCNQRFEFPVESNIQSFEFDCTNCGSHNEVEL
jgi:hypothetical protein